MAPALINANPVVHERKERPPRSQPDYNDAVADVIDAQEIFDILPFVVRKNWVSVPFFCQCCAVDEGANSVAQLPFCLSLFVFVFFFFGFVFAHVLSDVELHSEP